MQYFLYDTKRHIVIKITCSSNCFLTLKTKRVVTECLAIDVNIFFPFSSKAWTSQADLRLQNRCNTCKIINTVLYIKDLSVSFTLCVDCNNDNLLTLQKDTWGEIWRSE